MQSEESSVEITQQNVEPEILEVKDEKVVEEKELPETALDESDEDNLVLEERRRNMSFDAETALVETVLFLESEPQTTENLAKITKLADNIIEECLDILREKYSAPNSGIEISQMLGGWILTPKKESFAFVKERYGKKNEGKLSKSAIETLCIIAYSQPITRAEIESYRHVNVDNMMRVLLDRKLICEDKRKDVPGKPMMYKTTKEFLEFFNLQSIDDLPKLDDVETQRFELARNN